MTAKMFAITVTDPFGNEHVHYFAKFTDANTTYWQAKAFTNAADVEAHGFIPKRSNPYRSFSYGKREAAMHTKHEAVVPKNARMVNA